MIKEKDVKWVYSFFLIIGILFLILGIVSVFLEEYQYAYSKIIVGFVFIITGILFKPVIKWKEMPKGMKIIVVFLWFGFLTSLWKVYTQLDSPDILLGFPLQFPLSTIAKLIGTLIPLMILISIYSRRWWDLILWLQGFSIINYLASAVWMIITPLNKLFEIMGEGEQIIITPQVEFLTKLFMLIPISLGLIIGIIIWIYFLNKEDYFQK